METSTCTQVKTIVSHNNGQPHLSLQPYKATRSSVWGRGPEIAKPHQSQVHASHGETSLCPEVTQNKQRRSPTASHRRLAYLQCETWRILAVGLQGLAVPPVEQNEVQCRFVLAVGGPGKHLDCCGFVSCRSRVGCVSPKGPQSDLRDNKWRNETVTSRKKSEVVKHCCQTI